jgi:hypothetical protein
MTTQPHAEPTKSTAAKFAPLARFALARLREPSTWRGIVLFISGCGAAISPALALQIVSVGVSVAGLIGMLLGDAPNDTEE